MNSKKALNLIIKKKLKARSFKTKKQLVQSKTLTKIDLLLTESRFLPVLLRRRPKLREVRPNNGKVQNFTEFFLKQLYSNS